MTYDRYKKGDFRPLLRYIEKNRYDFIKIRFILREMLYTISWIPLLQKQSSLCDKPYTER